MAGRLEGIEQNDGWALFFVTAGLIATLGSLAAIVTGLVAAARGPNEFAGAVGLSLGLSLLMLLGFYGWIVAQLPP